jgi:hypothetical protein
VTFVNKWTPLTKQFWNIQWEHELDPRCRSQVDRIGDQGPAIGVQKGSLTCYIDDEALDPIIASSMRVSFSLDNFNAISHCMDHFHTAKFFRFYLYAAEMCNSGIKKYREGKQ